MFLCTPGYAGEGEPTAGERSLIRTYTHRLKDPRSIHEKLVRQGYPITWKSILENLNDVAGVRIICEYLQDIETVRDGLLANGFLELLREKDYIRYPKPNGYRSLHLIVNVPVPMSDGPRKIRCEIQLRTTAMDCWAGLEHNLRYKKNRDYDENIDHDLKDCADMLFETDQRLQDIALRMEILERQNSAYSNHQESGKGESANGQKSS